LVDRAAEERVGSWAMTASMLGGKTPQYLAADAQW
jgi:hypothetical protein